MKQGALISKRPNQQCADVNAAQRKEVKQMCMTCPEKGKCKYVQTWEDCSLCQFAVKGTCGEVIGCSCPPAQTKS